MELANVTTFVERATSATANVSVQKSKPDTYKESLRYTDRPIYYQAELKHLEKIIDIGVVKLML